MQVFQRLSTCPTIPEVTAEVAKARPASWPDTLPLAVWCRPSILLALREQAHSGAVSAMIGFLLAADGTRIKAVNNKDRSFTRASLSKFIRLADAKLEDYLRRLDQSDVTENPAGGARVKTVKRGAQAGAIGDQWPHRSSVDRDG
jgi:hypothetical protein